MPRLTPTLVPTSRDALPTELLSLIKIKLIRFMLFYAKVDPNLGPDKSGCSTNWATLARKKLNFLRHSLTLQEIIPRFLKAHKRDGNIQDCNFYVNYFCCQRSLICLVSSLFLRFILRCDFCANNNSQTKPTANIISIILSTIFHIIVETPGVEPGSGHGPTWTSTTIAAD